jgi:glycosyltransferase involved in cell wall biosynthesis
MRKISVCIPTYNGSKYIKEQLDSILSQLSENDEVILSDDRSTDNTVQIIESYNDNRIKIVTHEKIRNAYRGPYKTIYYVYRNIENALKHATGDYVFLSDQDDIWLPNKVNRVLDKLESGQEIVLHNNTVIDNAYNELLSSYFAFSHPSNNKLRIILRCFIQGASMAFTKRIKDYSLPFPKNPISHDHWIAYNAIFRGYKVAFIQEPLLLYRRHGGNVSPSSEKSLNPLWFKISYRFLLVWAVILVKYKIRHC